MPTIVPDVPVECEGTDEDGVIQKFWGREIVASNGFELNDPLRNIKTYDFGKSE
jgi:hypothetical protein